MTSSAEMSDLNHDENRLTAYRPLPAKWQEHTVDLVLGSLAAGAQTVRIAVLVESPTATPTTATLVPPDACHAAVFLYGSGRAPTGVAMSADIQKREAAQRTPFDRRLDVTSAIRALPADADSVRVTLVITDAKGRAIDAEDLTLQSIDLEPRGK